MEAIPSTSDVSSIALLRRLRAGETIPFVHAADVCSAAPADLVAAFQPVPGTDRTDDGYNSIWYFFSPKKYKNSRGKPSGHRQRAIVGGDTCWRPEVSAKDVDGPHGGTFCNLSYGRKNVGSGRSFDRLGWCMVEYDDQLTSNNGGSGDHVLCKLYRSSSSLAKCKSKQALSASSSSSSTSSTSTTPCKRKAAAEDQAEARVRPTKFVVHEQDQNTSYRRPMTPCYAETQDQQHRPRVQLDMEQQQGGYFVDTEDGLVNVDDWINDGAFGGDEDREQQSGDPEQGEGGEFVQIPSGGLLVPALTQATVDEMLDQEMAMSGAMAATSSPLDADFFAGMDLECLFGAVQQQQQPMTIPACQQQESHLMQATSWTSLLMS